VRRTADRAKVDKVFGSVARRRGDVGPREEIMDSSSAFCICPTTSQIGQPPGPRSARRRPSADALSATGEFESMIENVKSLKNQAVVS
jgi:hypothetical protein